MTRAEIDETFRAEGLSPHGWGNGPGDTYGTHSHSYHKVLYCVSGSIVFHTPDGDVELVAGDRLELPPGTPHSATVGTSGCECMEASR
jgi:mannose-6-phosphate isomerase-like protein (cupin superfamily)